MKRSVLILAIFALMAALVMPSLGARANPDADGLWATTAEFDAGTKSQPIPADGNYGVESITDNPGIAANVIELASLKGDAFTLADTDAITFKWLTSATRCTVGSPTTRIRNIGSGVLDLGATTSSGTTLTGVVSSATITNGDIDIQTKIVAYPQKSTSARIDLYILNEQGCDNQISGTVDGAEVLLIDTGSGNMNFRLLTFLNSAGTTCVNTGVGSSFPLWIRATLTGQNWVGYTSTDGSSWTNRGNCNQAVSGGFYMAIQNTASAANAEFNVDDLKVSVGTPASNGFRISGNWLSDNYVVGGTLKRVGFVLLNFTGISATYAIDKVELYRNEVLREVFANDIATGTSANLTVSEVIESGANVSVRVYLKGDGAGTATITRLQVFMVTLVNLVSTVSAYQIGAHSVILAGNVTYDAEPDGWLQIIFDFGTTPQAHERVNVGWVDGAGNFTILLYELDPATIYYFHARVDGNISGYADGDLMQFETLGTAGLSPILILLLASFVIALFIGLRSSPLFLILAGLLLLDATVVVDADLLSSQADLVRYGTFVVLVIMSLLLFVQGALNLPDEFKGGGWKLGGH